MCVIFQNYLLVSIITILSKMFPLVLVGLLPIMYQLILLEKTKYWKNTRRILLNYREVIVFKKQGYNILQTKNDS